MKANVQALYTSIVRTVVPYLVGFVLSFLASYNITPVDSSFAENLSGVLTFLFGAGYYIIVRVISRKYPKTEWLLGSPVKPTYKKG